MDAPPTSLPAAGPASIAGRARASLAQLPWISLVCVATSIAVYLAMASTGADASEAMRRFGYFPADAIWDGAYWGLVTSV